MSYTVQDHCKLIAKMRRSGLTVDDMDEETAKSFLYLHQEALTDFARKRQMKASDYLFAVYEDDETICIVSREYWNEHEAINDTHFQGAIDSILPEGFEEVSESTFHYNGGSLVRAAAVLCARGFERIPDEKRP